MSVDGRLHSFLSGLVFLALTASGLFSQSALYRFPMEGTDFLISGTFAELRPAHFHAGLDVKTEGLVGKPLLAVADGYVYRIQVGPDSYGNALYIRHRDGNISVFAHLSRFAPQIEEKLYQTQYATKRWEQDLYLDESEIPVRAGQLVAYSGNSGHSMGPHLHFEIRDEQENVLNPLAFFRHLIRDDVPPVLQRIALQPLDANARVNGRFQKLELVPEGKKGHYSVPAEVLVNGRVGLEYQAYDLLSGAANPCGINFAKLFLDGKLIYEYRLEHFRWEDKKDIDVHFDFAHYQRTGRRLERCYISPWNKFEAYRNVVNNGEIELKDDRGHDLRLELKDLHGNATVVTVRVRRGTPAAFPKELSFPDLTTIDGQFVGPVFVGRLQNPSTAHLQGLQLSFPQLRNVTVKPAWFDGNTLYFVADFSKEPLPPFAFGDPITGKSVVFNFLKMIDPELGTKAEAEEFLAFFPEQSTYYPFPLTLNRQEGSASTCSGIFNLGSEDIPLRAAIKVGIQPTKPIRPEHLVVAQRSAEGAWKFAGNERGDDGRMYASVTSMGAFTLMADSVPPQITPLNFTAGAQIPASQQELVIEAKDNFTGINADRIHVTLDGEWILFAFDRKTNSLTHTLRQRPAPGPHEIEVMVFDEANNLGSRRFMLYF